MTDKQKKQIEKMRTQGKSCSLIAEELGLSVNTVKSYCRRKSARKADAAFDGSHCMMCGKEIQQTLGRKQKKFCSDSCRMQWWKAHPEGLSRKAVYTFTCAFCGREFTAYGNSRRKYCSHSCYISARFGDGAYEK